MCESNTKLWFVWLHRKNSRLSRLGTKQWSLRQRNRRWQWGRLSWQKEAMLPRKFYSINVFCSMKRRKSKYCFYIVLSLLTGVHAGVFWISSLDSKSITYMVLSQESDLILILWKCEIHTASFKWLEILAYVLFREPKFGACVLISARRINHPRRAIQ